MTVADDATKEEPEEYTREEITRLVQKVETFEQLFQRVETLELERQQRLQVENSFLRPAYDDEGEKDDGDGDESMEEIRELRKIEADLERRQRSVLFADGGDGGGGDDNDDHVEQLNAEGETGTPAKSALPQSQLSNSDTGDDEETGSSTHEVRNVQIPVSGYFGDSMLTIDDKTVGAPENRRRNFHESFNDEGIEVPLLPPDTFSFLAFTRLKSSSMIASIFVICIQLTTLSLLCVDLFAAGSSENRLAIPPGVSPATSVIQVLALIIAVFSQTDYQDSLNCLFTGYHGDRLKLKLGVPVPKWRWLLSLWVRIIVSITGLVMTFFLIVSNSDPTDLLLDFTAIEFVTNLDNMCFWLCAWGYLGFEAQRDGSKVALAKPYYLKQSNELEHYSDGTVMKKHHLTVHEAERYRGKVSVRETFSKSQTARASTRALERASPFGRKRPFGRKKFPRCTFLTVLTISVVTGWAIVLYRQQTGYYTCNTIYVEFDDVIAPELATFSGLFYYNRNGYDEMGHGAYSGTARFAYCAEERSWTFVHGTHSSPTALPEACDWRVKSEEIDPLSQDRYDLIDSHIEEWTIEHQGRIISTGINMKCFDCRASGFCGDNGVCVDNLCVCDNGWQGYRCEFQQPCSVLETDEVYPPFVGNRKWEERYKVVTINDAANSRAVEVYGHPVYVSDGLIPDIIFFNGYRWAIGSAADFGFGTTNDEDVAAYFSGNFHGFWSQYTLGFLSSSVGVDSPDNTNTPVAVGWYQAQLKNGVTEVQGPDWTKPIDSKMLCATCSNDTNPCLFGGLCMDDYRCQCTEGSTGKLCHIPPKGNGECNPYFNTPEFDFDGGDCCKQTCVSTLEYTCGEGVIGQSFGIDAYGYVGFPNCKEPFISQEPTVRRIQKRGYLICGSFRTAIKPIAEFYSNQCRAIAAAVFGNPPSFEMVYWETDRFNDLNRGEYDVIFGTDFTASRDIFEKSSQSPFNFATLPSLFSGLVFGGYSQMVKCADAFDYFSEECQNVMVCTEQRTTFEDFLRTQFPPDHVVTVPSSREAVRSLDSGLCNVIAGYPFELHYSALALQGFTGSENNYTVTEEPRTKSFEAWVTRPDDRIWSQFVQWVMEALVQAEEAGVTKSSSYEMSKTFVFGEEFQDMFRNAVAAVSNYGDLWGGNMPFNRTGLNMINDGTTGRILAMDLGAIDDEGPGPQLSGTIQRIRDRGFLKCAVLKNEGFASFDEVTSTWSGMDVDLCKGIAAALLDGDPNVEIVPVSFTERFTALEGRAVDLSLATTRTLEREVKYPGTGGTAFDFSPIYFYDGMVFAGVMPYGKCAEDLEFFGDRCRDTKICVPQGTSWLDAMLGHLDIPLTSLVITDSFDDSFVRHAAGECNTVVGEIGWLKPSQLTSVGFDLESSDYYFGKRTHTKEPLGVISRSDDAQFSDFVRWIMYGYFHAEERDISQERALEMPVTFLFGASLSLMWQHSIQAVGHYGEIFERNLSYFLQRTGLNMLNTEGGPQLYACPGTLQ